MLCLPVWAQQQAKVGKIGWLANRPAAGPDSAIEVVRRELHALGYVEGKNIAFEYRYIENEIDGFPPSLTSWSVSDDSGGIQLGNLMTRIVEN